MSLHDEAHLHHFLRNKEMNEMYISVFLMSLAQGLISVFVPIYLYSLGYSVTTILLFYLLISLFFVILSPFFSKIIAKIGAKHSMGLSIPFYIMYFLGLGILEASPWTFYILPLLISIRLIFYNIGYHLNYLEHADSKNKEGKKEVSILMSMPLIASLLSPLIGGFIISWFDYSYLYTIGAILLSLSIVPLLLTKDKEEKIKFKAPDLFKDIISKKNRNLSLSFMGYASATIVGIIIWPIFLTSLDISARSIGIIISSAAILTLVFFFFTKEKYNNKKLEEKEIKRRTLLNTLGWIGRIFTDSIFLAFLVDSYKKITFRLISVTWTSYTYGIARKQDYFRFIMWREITFNLSRVIFIPILIWFFSMDTFSPFTLSFILAAILSMGYSLIVKRI